MNSLIPDHIVAQILAQEQALRAAGKTVERPAELHSLPTDLAAHQRACQHDWRVLPGDLGRECYLCQAHEAPQVHGPGTKPPPISGTRVTKLPFQQPDALHPVQGGFTVAPPSGAMEDVRGAFAELEAELAERCPVSLQSHDYAAWNKLLIWNPAIGRIRISDNYSSEARVWDEVPPGVLAECLKMLPKLKAQARDRAPEYDAWVVRGMAEGVEANARAGGQIKQIAGHGVRLLDEPVPEADTVNDPGPETTFEEQEAIQREAARLKKRAAMEEVAGGKTPSLASSFVKK